MWVHSIAQLLSKIYGENVQGNVARLPHKRITTFSSRLIERARGKTFRTLIIRISAKLVRIMFREGFNNSQHLKTSLKNELCLPSVLKVVYTLWVLSKDLHLSRICNYGIIANLRECRRAENMFSVFYCSNSSRLEYDQYSLYLVQLQKYFGAFWYILWAEKFHFSWQIKETLSCLICIVFPFRELGASFCQNWNSLHCQMYIQICVTWYKPTEHTEAHLLCLDNEIWAHQRIKKTVFILGSWERGKHCILRSTYWEQVL